MTPARLKRTVGIILITSDLLFSSGGGNFSALEIFFSSLEIFFFRLENFSPRAGNLWPDPTSPGFV
jgi:hypothetical protein